MIAAELIEKCFARIQRAASAADAGEDMADACFAAESAVTVALRSLLLVGERRPAEALEGLAAMLQATLATRQIPGQQVIRFSLEYLHSDRARQVSLA